MQGFHFAAADLEQGASCKGWQNEDGDEWCWWAGGQRWVLHRQNAPPLFWRVPVGFYTPRRCLYGVMAHIFLFMFLIWSLWVCVVVSCSAKFFRDPAQTLVDGHSSHDQATLAVYWTLSVTIIPCGTDEDQLDMTQGHIWAKVSLPQS